MATQAVDIARRTGDNAALVDAIRLCHESITMPQTLELRRRWGTEACDLADDLGDPTARLFANLYRSLAALEAGDLATMRTQRDLPLGSPSGSDNRSTDGRSRTPRRGCGCSKATSTPPSRL